MKNFKFWMCLLSYALFLVSACGNGGSGGNGVEGEMGGGMVEKNFLEYNNIIIYSDLSSRIDKKPNDSMVIEQLLDYFIKDCVKPGIKINDRSSISFSKINFFNTSCPSAKIDVGDISPLKEKQQFVNNTSSSKNLSQEIDAFRASVNCNYEERDNGGLDILSLLVNEIGSGKSIKKDQYIFDGKDTSMIKFHNHLFIFSDGYLEYSKEYGDPELYFGQPEIEELRKHCIKENISARQAVKDNPYFRIKPLKSDNNRFVRLYVLETDDRGLNIETGTLKNTGDLSDNNILKTIWEIWAIESGFQHFTWKQITKPSSLPGSYVRGIISSAMQSESTTSRMDFPAYDSFPISMRRKFDSSSFSSSSSTISSDKSAKSGVNSSRTDPLSNNNQNEANQKVSQAKNQRRSSDFFKSVFSITTEDCEMWDGPDQLTKIREIESNTKIEVVGFKNGFWKVKLADESGFVAKHYIYATLALEKYLQE